MDQVPSKKIAIVEDDKDYAALLERVLKTTGFSTIVFNEPIDLINRIIAAQAHLILLDIMLPNVSGLSILEDLKKNEKTKDIPVFCITNLPEEVGREKAIALGAYSYLTKVHYNIYDVAKHVELYFQEKNEK